MTVSPAEVCAGPGAGRQTDTRPPQVSSVPARWAPPHSRGASLLMSRRLVEGGRREAAEGKQHERERENIRVQRTGEGGGGEVVVAGVNGGC